MEAELDLQGDEAKASELPLEDRAANALKDLFKDSGPFRKFHIRRALKDLDKGKFERAQGIIDKEVVKHGESAMVAENYSTVLGHAPGSVPHAWDKAMEYIKISNELKARNEASKK